jgi:hypothetical protein
MVVFFNKGVERLRAAELQPEVRSVVVGVPHDNVAAVGCTETVPYNLCNRRRDRVLVFPGGATPRPRPAGLRPRPPIVFLRLVRMLAEPRPGLEPARGTCCNQTMPLEASTPQEGIRIWGNMIGNVVRVGCAFWAGPHRSLLACVNDYTGHSSHDPHRPAQNTRTRTGRLARAHPPSQASAGFSTIPKIQANST